MQGLCRRDHREVIKRLLGDERGSVLYVAGETGRTITGLHGPYKLKVLEMLITRESDLVLK